MGSLLSSLVTVISTFIERASSCNVYLVHPFQYVRTYDHDACGEPRQWVPEYWNAALLTLGNLEMNERKKLRTIIEKRMIRMEAARKYTHCRSLRKQIGEFPEWDAEKLFRVYDLFKLYEMDGDGVIEVAEMSVGMDNMGDHTEVSERVRILCLYDEDKTGFIDYEEFMNIIYSLQVHGQNRHSIGKHYQRVENDYEFLKGMTYIQRLSIGVL